MAVIAFDVNETLLDLSGLEGRFTALAGDRGGEVRRLWFARLLHASTVMNAVGVFADFGEVGTAVLGDVCELLGVAASEDEVRDVVAGMRQLDAHPEVPGALDRLAVGGHRLVALTNSGRATAEVQLEAAGIAGRFERIIGVDAVGRFKPDAAVYRHAEEATGARLLVAAHDWDCAGAMAAGWRAAFVDRPGQVYATHLPAATWRGADLDAVAELLLAHL